MAIRLVLIKRITERDAIEHAVKALDKTAALEVKYINSFKGRGVFATAHFQKGDFVVEYRGELIRSEESQRRRSIYHSRCAVFMFDFYWRERAWCVDAAQEDGSLGRLVNDDHYHPNCKMKKVIAEGKPRLFLFALKDINAGEEITYDYGGTDWPWRKQAGPQTTVTESSEAQTSTTTEEAPQTSSLYQMKGSDGPGPLPPIKTVGMNPTLVNGFSESQITSSQREENETTMPDVSHMDAAPQESTMASPQACDRKSPKRKKGRPPFQRRMWEKEEILAVEKHMMSSITSCRVPAKNDCDKCLELEKVALKNRNWSALKFYIKNRITALKRTF